MFIWSPRLSKIQYNWKKSDLCSLVSAYMWNAVWFWGCGSHRKQKVIDLDQWTPAITSQMSKPACFAHDNNPHNHNQNYSSDRTTKLKNKQTQKHSQAGTSCCSSLSRKERVFLSFLPMTKGFQEWLANCKYYRNHVAVTHCQPSSGFPLDSCVLWRRTALRRELFPINSL